MMPHQKEFLKFMEVYRKASKATLLNYPLDLKSFYDFSGGKININKTTIDGYVEFLLQEKKEARSTINRRLSCLKSYFNFLYNEEILERNPGEKIRFLKKDANKIKKIPKQEKIFETLDAIENLRDRALLETIYCTGLRESEASNLNIEHVDFENGIIAVIKSKGDKSRAIPISNNALKLIKAYLGSRTSGPVFLNNRYKRLGTRSIYNICKLYFDFPPHDLRHSFGTHMLAKTGNLKAVSEMMGHSDMQTTANIYSHLSSDYLADIYKGGGMDR